jgi:LmbE family N-acetylglucosaminyl deacetylase/glycosyltransferase involved in cell wall biosynthesis
MRPRVSLLLITYNKVSYLRATLLALQLLDFPTEDFEVVVVDDGSTDHTAAFLSEFEPSFQLRSIHQVNLGRAAARNTSIRAARGELLVILDDDFFIRPDSVRRLWQAYLADPDAIFISRLEHIAVSHVPRLLDTVLRDGCVAWEDLDDFAPVGDEYALADLRRRMLSYGIERFAVPWLAAQGMSVSMSKRVADQLDGYDGRFKKYGMEDFDIAYRFHEQGGRFVSVRESMLYHLDHGHNRTVLFKESTETTRAFYEKFQSRPEIKQFIKFLCGALSFRELNNFAAQASDLAPIQGFNLRFSPFGMIRYRDQQLGEEAALVHNEYSKVQQFRLRFLVDRIARDLDQERGRPLPALELDQAKSVLVIAPHMDDEVIGCGGLVSLLSQGGSTVTTVFLTDGSLRNLAPSDVAQLRRDRRGESERAADILGVERSIYLNIPERNLALAAQDPGPMLRVLDECQPDIVMVPGHFEHHPDHRVACQWLQRALQGSQSRPLIVCYEVWGSCRPTHLLRLDEASWRRKVRALSMYQTQLRELDYQSLMSFVNGVRGDGGVAPAKAEAYRCMPCHAFME